MYIAQSSNQSPLWVRGHFLPYPFTWYLGESSYTYTYTYNTLASVLLSRFLVSERADSLLPLAPKRFFSRNETENRRLEFFTLYCYFSSRRHLCLSLSLNLSLFFFVSLVLFSRLFLCLSHSTFRVSHFLSAIKAQGKFWGDQKQDNLFFSEEWLSFNRQFFFEKENDSWGMVRLFKFPVLC